MAKKINHPILSNPNIYDGHSDVDNIISHISSPEFTEDEYKNLLLGKYTPNGTNHDIDDLFYDDRLQLKYHPYNNQKNNTYVFNKLEKEYDKQYAKDPDAAKTVSSQNALIDLAKNTNIDPDAIHRVIDRVPHSELRKRFLYSLDEMKHNINKDHLEKLARKEKNIQVLNQTLDHPAMNKELFDKILRKNKYNISGLPNAARSDFMDPKLAATTYKASQEASNSEKMSLLGKMPEDAKQKEILSKLGVTDNGSGYDGIFSSYATRYGKLPEEAIEHIKNNGRHREKFNLFNNENTPINHKEEMHNKWLNDEEGYSKEALKNSLTGPANPEDFFDDAYEYAKDKATSAYPIDRFREDNAIDPDVPNEDIYGDYDEALSDDIYRLSRDYIDEQREDALSNPNLLPSDYQEHLKNKAKDPNLTSEDISNIDPNHPILHHLVDHPNFNESHIENFLYDTDSPSIKEVVNKKAEEGALLSENTIKVKTGTHPLRQLRDLIESNGGVMKKQDFKKLGANTTSIDKLFNPKGEIHSKDIQNFIDQMPSNEYGVSFSNWGGVQRHSSKNSKVFQLNYTKNHLQEMKDAGVYDTFKNLTDLSRNSNHPVKGNTLGWARFTGDLSNGFHIDEIQSDFGQSVIKRARQQAKDALRSGAITEDQADTAINNAESKFPDEHINIINKILFKGKHPSEVIHEGFKEHLRNEGYGDTPIHIWQPESKAPMSGQHTQTRILPSDTSGHIERIKNGDISTNEHALLNWGKQQKIIPQNLKELKHEHLDDLKNKYQEYAQDYINKEDVPDDTDNRKGPKLPIPLPVHMQEGYGKQPKAMKYQEGVYGELPTQENETLKGQPTYKEIVRKSEDLNKAINEDTHIAILQPLVILDQHKHLLEHIKQSNPDAYKAIYDLAEVLKDIVKELTGENIEKDIKTLEDQVTESDSQQPQEQEAPQQDQSEQEPQEAHIKQAHKDPEIHHNKLTFAPGAIRQYADNTQRVKDADGQWHSAGSGLKTLPEQS